MAAWSSMLMSLSSDEGYNVMHKFKSYRAATAFLLARPTPLPDHRYPTWLCLHRVTRGHIVDIKVSHGHKSQANAWPTLPWRVLDYLWNASFWASSVLLKWIRTQRTSTAMTVFGAYSPINLLTEHTMTVAERNACIWLHPRLWPLDIGIILSGNPLRRWLKNTHG